MLQRGSLWAACALSFVLVGCLERDTGRVGPEVGFGQDVSLAGSGVTEVDVMFVVDTSPSMAHERINLAAQIRSLVYDLASPPDRNSDSVPDWNPAQSLRIGIVTTDVGTGSVTFESTTCEPNGDDGRLVGGVFEWQTGDDPDAFAASVRDVVSGLPGDGCAFEQPLEATARAMAHADEYGFPRQDGLLAVVLVTDEDDCSVANDDLFFSAIAPGEPNIHCAKYRAQLTPNAELLQVIQGGRDPYNFVFAAITGIPRGLRDNSPTAVLNDPLMQDEFIDPVGPGLLQVREACEFVDPETGDSLGEAAPARKIVEFAALVPDSVLTTICTDDFGPAVHEIGERVGSRVPGVCLVRAIPDAAGTVPCEATVTLPEGETCTQPGYSEIGRDGDRAICAIAQVAEGSTEGGFYYDADNDDCPQLAFTEPAIPPIGSDVNAQCFFQLFRADGEQCARASQCGSGFCDPIARTCAPPPPVEGPGEPIGP
jgi:hypothetical protein